MNHWPHLARDFMTPHIDSYNFGHMVIAGISYTKDVIIFPDGNILSPWWRSKGHALAEQDLAALLAAGPELIICGTGFMGLMRPSKDLEECLKANKIEFIPQKSPRAVETYNRVAGGRRIGACFHLTC
jgi:hypothetical protein